jgi:hypothetical protein
MELMNGRKSTLPIDKVFAMYGLLTEGDLEANYEDNEDIALAKLVLYLNDKFDYSWLSNISVNNSKIKGLHVLPHVSGKWEFSDDVSYICLKIKDKIKIENIFSNVFINTSDNDYKNLCKIKIQKREIKFYVKSCIIGFVNKFLNIDDFFNLNINIIINSLKFNYNADEIILKSIIYIFLEKEIPYEFISEYQSKYGLYASLKNDSTKLLYKILNMKKFILCTINNNLICIPNKKALINDVIIKTKIKLIEDKNKCLYIILDKITKNKKDIFIAKDINTEKYEYICI